MTNLRKHSLLGLQILIVLVAGFFIYKNAPAFQDGFTFIGSLTSQTASLISSQPSYSVKVSTDGPGVVIGELINCGSSCSATVPYGTSVMLSANPADGYELALWGGSCSGASTNCNFSMAQNSTVTASFVPINSDSSTTAFSEGSSSAPFFVLSSPYSKTLHWKTATYSSIPSFNVNLIKKVSDSPLSYDLVRHVGENIPNTGSFTWSSESNEVGSNFYVEVTCGSDTPVGQECHISDGLVKIN